MLARQSFTYQNVDEISEDGFLRSVVNPLP